MTNTQSSSNLASVARARRIWGIGLVTLVILAAIVIHLVASSEIRANESMLPTLNVGETYKLKKRDFAKEPPKRGEIVAYKVRDALHLHRVIGVPGDTVSFKGHAITLNGTLLSQTTAENGAKLLAEIRPDHIEPGVKGDTKALYEIKKETLDSKTYFVLQRKENAAAELLTGEAKIPDGEIWVAGDNRDNSLGSFMFGPIPANSVDGVVENP